MSSNPNLLVTGATGYIGGSVLFELLASHPEIQYTAIVRNPKDVAAVEAIGVKVVQGSTSDHDLLTKLSSEYDVVVNTIDADDLEVAKAIIAGLEDRAKNGNVGRQPILIHTSGTGVVCDEATGSFNPGTSEKIWNDNSVEDIKGIDAKQPHRNVDLEIFAAGERKLIDTYIIAPSTIYGKGQGPVRNVSQQIPGLIREAVKQKQPIYVGEGTNLWNNVHIKDLARLYVLVFEVALSGENKAKPYENFYWGSVGEHRWKDIVIGLGKILARRGLVDTETPKSVPPDPNMSSLFYTSNNSRTFAERSKGLGWKPSEKSVFDTLEEDIDITVSPN